MPPSGEARIKLIVVHSNIVDAATSSGTRLVVKLGLGGVGQEVLG